MMTMSVTHCAFMGSSQHVNVTSVGRVLLILTLKHFKQEFYRKTLTVEVA
jgi:hypothetical protein